MATKRPKASKPAKTVQEPAAALYRAREVTARATIQGRVVAAAEFKARCLSLMDHVRATGTEIIVTKRNRPVARLVPVVETVTIPFIGRSAGVIVEHGEGDIVAPVAPDWDVGADL